MPNVLSQKAVLCGVKISRWTARRADEKVTAEVHKKHQADSDAGMYRKRLLPRDALSSITTIASEARHYHYRMTLPWLDQGMRLLPSKLFLEYRDQMADYRDKFDAAVDQFATDYPKLMRAAKKELNGLFDPADYPAASEIRSFFGIDVSILPCPDAEDFRVSLTQEQMDEVRADTEKRMQEAVALATRDAVERIVETVGHMAERLRTYDPEKKEGIFRDSLVENVRDLAKILPALNLSGDNLIGDVADRIERQLCGADAGDLRDDAELRTKTADAAETILADVRDYMA